MTQRKTDSLFPFATVKGFNKRIPSANSSFQLATVPWNISSSKSMVLSELIIANLNGGAGAVHIWDQDLTNTGAPAGRGSAGTALITIGIAASAASGVSASMTNASVDLATLPIQQFRAGIAAQATVLNVHIMGNVLTIG